MSSSSSPPSSPRRRHLYTDGGARPNPGPGGWAAVVVDPEGGGIEELSGGEPATTNNRMELTAAIRALEAQPAGSELDVYTDSRYVRQGITQWLPRWIRRGWKRPGDEEVKNRDLWQRLAEAESRHRVRWHWLRGHAGNEQNERADQLASAEIAKHAPPTVQPAAVASDREPVEARADIEGYVKIRCSNGRGEWIVLLVHDEDQRQLSGRGEGTTANRLELEAGLALLRSTPPELTLAVHAGDYLRRGASEWLAGWKRAGWRTGAGDAVKNVDLWRAIDRELAGRRVLWRGNPEGALAKDLSRRLKEAGG
jgi:ribonuclease HI